MRQDLSGWGRYPVEPCQVVRPEQRGALGPLLTTGALPHYIARGLGRSYGDAALNRDAGVIQTTRLNRLLAFDPETGVLHCEAGVTLAELIDVFLPRGFFLPVTPGTKFVTVGGAIANDIHGKNHHQEGSFGHFLVDFELLTATGTVLRCSPSENAEVFWATVGGVGLTGVILTARLRLKRVESAQVLVDYTRAPNLQSAIATMTATDAQYQYSVAWIDCLSTGAAMGRAVLMQGNPAPAQGPAPLARPPRRAKVLPFDMPAMALNPLSVGTFNTLFYHKHRNVRGKRVDFEPYFYPLDAIHGWNRLYGARGFVQYQVAFPESTSADGLTALLERLSGSGRASFLAVLKRFGPGNAGLLSFPMPGFTLALDLPMADGLPALLRELDRLVVAHGGRVYLAKDALVEPEMLAAMYPRLDAFRAIQRRLDPEGRLSSSMARRLNLVGDFA